MISATQFTPVSFASVLCNLLVKPCADGFRLSSQSVTLLSVCECLYTNMGVTAATGFPKYLYLNVNSLTSLVSECLYDGFSKQTELQLVWVVLVDSVSAMKFQREREKRESGSEPEAFRFFFLFLLPLTMLLGQSFSLIK